MAELIAEKANELNREAGGQNVETSTDNKSSRSELQRFLDSKTDCTVGGMKDLITESDMANTVKSGDVLM